MAFPRRFQALIETTLEEVDKPDYAWLMYAVCAVTRESCGWQGWIISAVYQYSPELLMATGRDKLLPADYEARCPRCNLPLFGTSAKLRFEPSRDQTPIGGVAGVDYEVAPIEYCD
jgi:hypothetical protein